MKIKLSGLNIFGLIITTKSRAEKGTVHFEEWEVDRLSLMLEDMRKKK